MSSSSSSSSSLTSAQISEETQKLFREIEEEREKQSKFIKLQNGETRTFLFTASTEKIKKTEDEFEGKKSKRVHYIVTDPKLPNEGEKILPMSLSNSNNINALLLKGFNVIEVKRIGADRNTKYTFAPA